MASQKCLSLGLLVLMMCLSLSWAHKVKPKDADSQDNHGYADGGGSGTDGLDQGNRIQTDSRYFVGRRGRGGGRGGGRRGHLPDCPPGCEPLQATGRLFRTTNDGDDKVKKDNLIRTGGSYFNGPYYLPPDCPPGCEPIEGIGQRLTTTNDDYKEKKDKEVTSYEPVPPPGFRQLQE